MTSRLFISLYIDEDVDVLVAELLRARRFDALTTRDAGRLGQSDADQLAFSVSEESLYHSFAHFSAELTKFADFALSSSWG